MHKRWLMKLRGDVMSEAMTAFQRVDGLAYEGGSALKHINASYQELVGLLGNPWKATEPNYPDDDYKTDVCWCVRDSTGSTPGTLTIWNYKNGPRYTGEGTIEDIGSWSVYWTTDVIHDLFMDRLAAVKRATP